jgi:GTP-dependent dephospho-CoA kinase
VEIRSRLAMPFGSLVSEERAVEDLRRGELTATVGDVVSLHMLEKGEQPDLMVYDLRTERKDMSELESRLPSLPGMNVHVKNPAGRITPELVNAIEKALAQGKKVKLMVEGEEDLASLVIAALAPFGTRLLYGLPKKGIISVHVDESVRKKARDLIDAMEECN